MLSEEKYNEEILVLKTKDIFFLKKWQGINPNFSKKIKELVLTKLEFRKRGEVEEDFSLKQIISYIIFSYKNKYLLTQRLDKPNERRLASFYSFGIGGHLGKKDLENGSSLSDWAKREFEEEVDYKGNLKFETLGVLNDDSNPVGKVHLGLVVLAIGDSPDIKVKDEHKSGELLFLNEAKKNYKNMENWSKIVYDYLTF
jgi:predicted NUDIX family phosphoesterase